jgi:hypothetical protein
MKALDGTWNLELVADGEIVAREQIVSEWIAGGDFLLHRAETEVLDSAPQIWHDNAPRSSTVVMGADDPSGRYAFLYADSRGVHRVYEMTLDAREWRVWGRSGPEFFQRFLGLISEDGERIDARWERSSDGDSWELDFEAIYRRA